MFEVVLHCPQSLVETVCDALSDDLEALSVSVEDADADSQAERALFGEPDMPPPSWGWDRSTLRALFENEALATEATTLLLAQAWSGALRLVGMGPVADQDWVRLTQSQFSPVEITPRFWVVPTWHRPPDSAREVIRLDPGLAFGTGTHPTTRMCLRWIAHNAKPWSRVLDYGCGSGILGIAAALHGASGVEAVDIDPAAVQSAKDNALANGAEMRCGLPDLTRGPYPLVLANILATPLKVLAPLLCGHLQAEGSLVLAGILERQAPEMVATYAPWVALEVSDQEEGWVLMTGRRRSS